MKLRVTEDMVYAHPQDASVPQVRVVKGDHDSSDFPDWVVRAVLSTNRGHDADKPEPVRENRTDDGKTDTNNDGKTDNDGDNTGAPGTSRRGRPPLSR
jgi:hypothetical protein